MKVCLPPIRVMTVPKQLCFGKFGTDMIEERDVDARDAHMTQHFMAPFPSRVPPLVLPQFVESWRQHAAHHKVGKLSPAALNIFLQLAPDTKAREKTVEVAIIRRTDPPHTHATQYSWVAGHEGQLLRFHHRDDETNLKNHYPPFTFSGRVLRDMEFEAIVDVTQATFVIQRYDQRAPRGSDLNYYNLQSALDDLSYPTRETPVKAELRITNQVGHTQKIPWGSSNRHGMQDINRRIGPLADG